MCILIFGRRKRLALESKLEVALALLRNLQPASPHKPKSGKWFTAAQVCELLAVSNRTLARMRQRGEIPYNMVSHKTYYSEEGVRRAMRERLVPEREALVDATPGAAELKRRREAAAAAQPNEEE